MSYRKHFRQVSSDFGAYYNSLEPRPWVPSMEKFLASLPERPQPIPVRCERLQTKLFFPKKKALPLAFIVNELDTNSLKYAFPEGREGVIDVALKSDGGLTLAVSDNGVGRKPDTKTGVGTRLVDVMVQQL
jgi:two-component sensor histidine kinase